MGILLLAFLGLVMLGGDKGKPSSSTSLYRETLLEPPDASHPSADYLIELSSDGTTWWWELYGKPEPEGSFNRPEVAKGDATNREEAVQEVYDAIAEQRGKLPAPLNRHGLRVAADCRSIAVQQLEAWIEWASPKIDKVAGELAAANLLSGSELMRTVFRWAFPECPTMTPKIRGVPWDKVVQRVSAIVDRAKRGDFIDVRPIGDVLAARMVAMSAPKVDGAAFWAETSKGMPYAVVVHKLEDGGFRWRVWPKASFDLSNEPQEQGFAPKLEPAKTTARKYVEGLAT